VKQKLKIEYRKSKFLLSNSEW